MSWTSSTRRRRLPSDWQRIRKRILRRDNYECQWRIERRVICGEHATDVDHIEPGDDHSDTNLQSLCAEHHARKSAREGTQAARVKRQEIANRFVRREEHPGLTTPRPGCSLSTRKE